jgi:hypothetical protein
MTETNLLVHFLLRKLVGKAKLLITQSVGNMSEPKLLDPIKGATVYGMPMEDVVEYYCIKQAAKTNKALQLALDHVKVIYYLSKNHGP